MPEHKAVPDIGAIQYALREEKIDGWLFYDILHRDPIAYRVLNLHDLMAKRRWFYWIPAKGEPRKLVHRIESFGLDTLPGDKLLYSAQEELRKNLPKLLGRAKNLAMQYSPDNAIPSISVVDAGTIEMVRSFKKKVVSSANLVQRFEAAWTPEQHASHLEAGRRVDKITRAAFQRAAQLVRDGVAFTEFDLQAWMLEQFRENGLIADSAPNVSVGPHSGDPHYEPSQSSAAPIHKGDLMLLDVWAKLDQPNSVYYDITWMGYLGKEIPKKYSKIFEVTKRGRDAAINFVAESVKAGREIQGWQVDKVCRDVIRKAGYEKRFVHRTGHNIGQDVHGAGANMDNFESHDIRRIIPHTCFSVEPGIYSPEFGVRTEVNMYVGEREAGVTGAVQSEILALLD
jgi:Xaa-Pro dipeptidase